MSRVTSKITIRKFLVVSQLHVYIFFCIALKQHDVFILEDTINACKERLLLPTAVI